MSTRSLGQCLVCNDKAVGINFAVPTCAACKAFFRRNAVKLGVNECLNKLNIFLIDSVFVFVAAGFCVSRRW